MSGEASVSDDWELDPSEIQFLEKIASGAFGDLYKGLYCGQDVAIKILRDVQDDPQQYQEFLQVGDDSISWGVKLDLNQLENVRTCFLLLAI